jgi:siroheme synthase
MDPRTPDILRLVKSPLHILALVIVVVGTAVGFAASNLVSEQRWIVIVVGAVVLAAVLVTLYALEQLRTTALTFAGTRVHTHVIATRADLYRHCARLIATSQEIRDTTWGRDPRPLTPSETTARQEYREAVDAALRAGKVYREMFSALDNSAALVRDAQSKKNLNPQYEAKVIHTDLSRLSVIDFMVGDDAKVIFSHVDARHEVPMFVYVESRDIAQLFHRLFQECWSEAEELKHDRVA